MKKKLTNKLGLPEPILKAIENDPYDPGDSDYTATSLLKPSRMYELSKNVDVEEDASDRLYSLQGQIMHYILERAAVDLLTFGYLVEERLIEEFEVNGKVFKVSAQIDLFNFKTGVLSDYKYTTVYSSKYGLKEDHRLQLNLQAQLLRKAGYIVNRAEVILLFRDYHPERHSEIGPVMKLDVPLMSSEEVNSWVSQRIQAHEAAKNILPLCSSEERWANITFAVMANEDDARALRVFNSESEAKAYIAAKDDSLKIIRREGESRRCQRYCPARSICKQANKENEWKKIT